MTQVTNATITGKLEITVGSKGKRNKIGLIPVMVPWAELKDDVQLFIVRHGLKQYLADAAAGVTNVAAAKVAIDAKLAKLISGDLKRSKGSGVAKPDTVESRAAKLARADLIARMKDAKIEADKDAIKAAVAEMVADDPTWKAEAKVQLDAETKLKEAAPNDKMAGLLAKLKAAQAGAVDATDETEDEDDGEIEDDQDDEDEDGEEDAE